MSRLKAIQIQPSIAVGQNLISTLLKNEWCTNKNQCTRWDHQPRAWANRGHRVWRTKFICIYPSSHARIVDLKCCLYLKAKVVLSLRSRAKKISSGVNLVTLATLRPAVTPAAPLAYLDPSVPHQLRGCLNRTSSRRSSEMTPWRTNRFPNSSERRI